jgi:hypothetical protein
MAEKTAMRVTIMRDGPYMVQGDIPLSVQSISSDSQGGSEAWIVGKTYPAQEKYALCR